MKFTSPLIKGKLIKRYKRFLADVELESGEVVTAHCPNSGRMLGLDSEGFQVYLSEKPEGGKLKYGLELVDTETELVGVNTMHPNKIIAEALAAKQIPELANYDNFRREVKYGKNSRVDFLLTSPNLPDLYLEIKNVHLMRNFEGDSGSMNNPTLEFPDAVTERGAKHCRDLEEVVKQGHRAVLFFLCQRDDADYFNVAADIDPAYEAAFKQAIQSGVEVLCYTCKVTAESIEIKRRIEVVV